jgi:hypothetical protein
MVYKKERVEVKRSCREFFMIDYVYYCSVCTCVYVCGDCVRALCDLNSVPSIVHYSNFSLLQENNELIIDIHTTSRFINRLNAGSSWILIERK